MANKSFEGIVYLDNDMADRIIAAQERMKANPTKPSTHKPKWATDEDRKRIAESPRGSPESSLSPRQHSPRPDGFKQSLTLSFV